MIKKTCTKCLGEYELTPVLWHRKSNTKDGYSARCKKCNNEAKKQHKNSGKTVYISKEEGDILYRNFECKRCSKPTRLVYVHKDDVAKMANKYYCNECNGQISDESVFSDSYNNHYPDAEDVKASELPYMDTGGA